jgi:hypothetical protein
MEEMGIWDVNTTFYNFFLFCVYIYFGGRGREESFAHAIYQQRCFSISAINKLKNRNITF